MQSKDGPKITYFNEGQFDDLVLTIIIISSTKPLAFPFMDCFYIVHDQIVIFLQQGLFGLASISTDISGMILDGGKTDMLRGVNKLGFGPTDNFSILSV